MAEILFFGKLSDLSDNLKAELPEDVSTIADLVEWLSRQNEALGEGLKSAGTRYVLNQTMVDETAEIINSDEIAFMSPLSGG